ncbi:hypothetical protein OG194_21285 [Streptomyces sp. NBC_01288]|jgi:hypothetical protein|uniref:hypothetical protein n=1 Tax=unclassified Streptomyces TaxID=2593676 RepID=UPI002E10C154|nr:hypothetical protein OG194_21285 [Streptomyces sp. NBC_01288]
MADSSDVLLELWKDQRDQMRQLENQRATLTNIVILVVAAGLGFIAQSGLGPTMLAVTLPMMLLGSYGALACMKYRERQALHDAQALSLRKKLGDLHPSLSIDAGWADTYQRQQLRFPKLFRLRLYALWVALHLGVAAAGGVLSIWSLL